MSDHVPTRRDFLPKQFRDTSFVIWDDIETCDYQKDMADQILALKMHLTEVTTVIGLRIKLLEDTLELRQKVLAMRRGGSLPAITAARKEPA